MRNQRVFVNDNFSSLKFILAGVSKRPVLGPLLLLIYISDIADYLHSMARLFADDTSVSVPANHLPFLEHVLNTSLVKLKDWAK